ncbi:pilus assembly FimT family protein [Gemmatimonas sp.]|uniref:pilus assembly FimT family protein n=1 Tax=Gemmatimonas sp. TaxID=1962908 RepID=UPI003DA5CE33
MTSRDQTPARLRRPRAGYTILELLVVVAIVGITLGMVAPRFRMSGATAVQLAGTQMAQDIDVTRTRALSTRQLSRVAFREGAKAYGGYLDHNDDGVIGEVAIEWQELRGFGERPLPAGIGYGRGPAPAIPDDASGGTITFTNARVEFDSRGLVVPQGTGGVVYLRSETESDAVVAISVAPSGNTRLWTWKSVGGWK